MGKIETYLCGVEQIYIFFKILVETVEKVETYLNWVEQNRTLFFSGRESQNIPLFARESQNVPKFGRDGRNIPIFDG